MLIRTKIFGIRDGNYKNLSEMAQAMGVSISQIYRVRQGKRSINQKFIIGAIKAFPKHKFEDLFYLAPEPPTVTNYHCHKVQQNIMSDSLRTQRQISKMNMGWIERS